VVSVVKRACLPLHNCVNVRTIIRLSSWLSRMQAVCVIAEGQLVSCNTGVCNVRIDDAVECESLRVNITTLHCRSR